jgi:hypothetical protein
MLNERLSLLLHLLHKVSGTGEDDEVAGARLVNLSTTVVRRHQSFRHDVADAEAGLVGVGEARDATIREDLEPLRLPRIDRYRPHPIFVGPDSGVLCVGLDCIGGQPGEHQNVLIRQRPSISAIKNLHCDVQRLVGDPLSFHGWAKEQRST